MIVLDTHALVWLDQGNPNLGSQARRLADEALAEDALCVSAISFWEIAMLVARQRISIPVGLEVWRQELLDGGLQEIPVNGEIGICAVHLATFHADPADRIIVATAQRRDATLITSDQKILDWPGELKKHHARA